VTSEKSLMILSKKDPGGVTAILSGVMDEFSNFDPIQPPSSGILVLDLKGVHRCNSMGILRWGKFFKNLDPKLVVKLQNCSTIMVKQFNIFAGLLAHPGLEVESFYVSYTCLNCGASEEVFVNADDAPDACEDFGESKRKCTSCPGEMELDEWPEKQFLFLKRKKAAGTK
jgi:hypothetical protein